MFDESGFPNTKEGRSAYKKQSCAEYNAKYGEIAAMRLREIWESTDTTQKDFAKKHEINPTTLNKYLSGDIARMGTDVVGRLSRAYNISPGWLMGFDVEKYQPKEETAKKKIPVLGRIAAGIPILAQEEILDYELVPENIDVQFCLKVKGDSMINARIFDGDVVYIRQQPEVENGEIAAVLVDGEDATLKRFYRIDGTVFLRPENPVYPEITIRRRDAKDVKILGKAIEFKSKVR